MIQGLIAPSFFDFWFSQVLGARGMAVRLSLFPGGGVEIQGLEFAHGLPLLGALLFPTPLPKSRHRDSTVMVMDISHHDFGSAKGEITKPPHKPKS